jgi:hypothetical protein
MPSDEEALWEKLRQVLRKRSKEEREAEEEALWEELRKRWRKRSEEEKEEIRVVGCPRYLRLP